MSNRQESLLARIPQLIKNFIELLLGFKNTIIIIIVWIIVSEYAGYSVFNLIRSVFKLLIYPINWLLYKTEFSATEIPEVFILLIPLLMLISIGFIVLISTED